MGFQFNHFLTGGANKYTVIAGFGIMYPARLHDIHCFKDLYSCFSVSIHIEWRNCVGSTQPQYTYCIKHIPRPILDELLGGAQYGVAVRLEVGREVWHWVSGVEKIEGHDILLLSSEMRHALRFSSPENVSDFCRTHTANRNLGCMMTIR